LNYEHGKHYVTGVEIEQQDLDPTNPNNVKEVQKLSFGVPDTRETHKITITYPKVGTIDYGTFRVSFTSPDLKRSNSGELKANFNWWQMRNGLNKYFNTQGVNTVVTVRNYDENGNETTDTKKTAKREYTIKIDRLVTKPTTASMVILKGTTKAKVELKANLQVSGKPITGKFKVKCLYPDPKNPGKFTYEETKPINLNSDSHWLTRIIGEQCPKLRNRIKVHSFNSPYTHWN